MENILVNIVSAIMLPLFVIMILCVIAGAKPEPVVKGILDLFVAIIGGLIKLAISIVQAIFGAFRPTPRRGPGRSGSSGAGAPRYRARGNRF